MKNTASASISKFSSIFDQNYDSLFRDYFQFLRFPSISADSSYRDGIEGCASWLEGYLSEAGLSVERWETPRSPTIFASWHGAGDDRPTVLFYNHYDVQPVDPIEQWVSPPFEPTVRDGKVYARGAQDNKGQCFHIISAVKHYLQEHGRLPVNVKLLIEGDEEIGCAGLSQIIHQKTDRLKADYVFIVDVELLDAATPTITLGLRGLLGMTVDFTCSNIDLHSGRHGGIIYNPNRALVEVLGRCYDREGRVTIPGFYDDVVDPSPEELNEIELNFDSEKYRKVFDAAATGGERNYPVLQRCWYRPSLEINGVSGGYSGEGIKTVIPARAKAKISARTVPNQDPQKLFEAIKKYFLANAPEGVTVKVTQEGGVGGAVRTSPLAAITRASAQAFSEVMEAKTKFVLDGATIAVTAALVTASGGELAMIGYGLPEDKIHAPNESFSIERLRKGFVTTARLMEILGGVG